VFVFLLFAYHGYCHYIFKQLQKNTIKWTSNFFRIWNEMATIILISVVFLVVMKNSIDWIYGVVGIIGLSIALMLGIKFYKNARNRNNT